MLRRAASSIALVATFLSVSTAASAQPPFIHEAPTRLTGTGTTTGRGIGAAVATDGTWAFIGSNPATIDQGGVLIFNVPQTSTPTGTWTLAQTIADPARPDGYGMAVAVRGMLGAIGAPLGGGNGTAFRVTYNGTTWATSPLVAPSSAACMVHTDMPSCNGDLACMWGTSCNIAQSITTGFGTAVAVGGGVVAVGVPGDSSTGVPGVVALYSGSTGAFQRFVVSPGNPAASDLFGASLAFSADGSVLVVGAPGDGGNAGAAYVFSSSDWTMPAITYQTGNAGAKFGASVGIDAAGLALAIGAPNGTGTHQGGSIYLYTRANTAAHWPAASDAELVEPLPNSGDHLGASVALGGGFVLGGADNSGGATVTNAGSAFLWDITTHDLMAIYVLNNQAAGDLLGHSLAISTTSSSAPRDLAIVIGAPQNGIGATGGGMGGLAGVYPPTLRLGMSCMASEQCGSNNCVDGVCCSSACGGGVTTDCMVCNSSGACVAEMNAHACMACGGSSTCDGTHLTCNVSGCDSGLVDGGMAGDAGGTGSDAGAMDAAPTPPVHISGCKCAVGRRSAPWGAVVGVLAMTLALARRRLRQGRC
jgi:hypothetical protein